jgi:hypothetical protein
VLQAELATLEPPILADAGEAAAALANLVLGSRDGRCGEKQDLRLIFEYVTVDDGRIVSVTPREAFTRYFQFAGKSGGKSGSDGTRTTLYPRDPLSRRSGATELESATSGVTGRAVACTLDARGVCGEGPNLCSRTRGGIYLFSGRHGMGP